MEEKQTIVTIPLIKYEKIKKELDDYKLKYQELVDKDSALIYRLREALNKNAELVDKIDSLEKSKNWRLWKR